MSLDHIAWLFCAQVVQKTGNFQLIFFYNLPVIHNLAYTYHILFLQQMLHGLEVDPAREKEMVNNFHNTFEPVIRKQPGFADVKLLKLRNAVAGKTPTPANYKLLISFQTEEQRLAWVATAEHQKVWPPIEKTLTGFKFNAILYDLV